ncbi:MAG: sugar phosphate isomerase/epimerase [Abditibacteriales bacterium]|nr:sugar phosphate isomerase/epimerase [Abditibacteriales bacterium]MDW8366509.1 sugar phosphate isomerase/epimerase [Abditibacteriales bacterium]
MRLGFSTWGMPQIPMDVAVPRLAAMGYEGIEITVLPPYVTALEKMDAAERGRIRQMLKEHRLALPAIAAHSSLVATDAEQHRANMTRLRGAVDLAVQWADDAPPVVNTTTGGKPEEWEQLKGLLVERLGELVEFAAARGVTIALEPHVGGAVDRPEKVLWLMEQIASPFLKVNLDYSHFQAQGWTVEESVPQLIPYTVHTHVKGVRGIVPQFEFLVPGEDEFDYAHYLRVTRDAGYDGFQTVEVSVMVQRRPDYEPFAAAELASRTLARAFAEAGIERSVSV